MAMETGIQIWPTIKMEDKITLLQHEFYLQI